MPIVSMPGLRPVNMGELAAEMSRDSDVIRVRAKASLDPYPRSLIDRLRHWAEIAPDRIFLADRGPEGEWRRLTYSQVLGKTRAIAQALIDRDLSTERPIVILSGNSIEHGLMALGAMMAGIAYAPVSPAYSLVSSDHAKLKHIFSLLTPGLVFAADGAPFAKALDAVMTPELELVVARDAPVGREATIFDDLLATAPSDAVAAAEAQLTGDTVAKFLFTSGSTGMPKAVINTHRMMACNQVMIATALAFLKDKPPVMVDWLPWNHTAGGNHNFGIALHNGGTLYIDDGNPTPAGILKTVRNLEEIAPTLYFNVPKGFEMLAEHLAKNDRLRETFFSRVELLQYAGAGLAQHVWDALERLAIETTGHKIMIVTGYGSTETAPFASTTTWPVGRPGEVGLPAPGLELKLIPDGEKLELRLKGPSITPGYWRQPDKTAECFDEEGFYKIGDALKFVDPDDVNKGFLFDGRVSEDFKLSTGTWVNMAGVRGGLISACAPYVRDVVLTGLNANHIGALLLLDFDAARKLDASLGGADEKTVAHHRAVRGEIQKRLDALAAKSTGSSNLVARAIILDTLPSIDKHEVTDKGSINQRAVMAARAELVDDLYAEPSPAHVITANRKAAS
ncbi:feruloyl-CoA synthase [Aliihoeflea sp. 40Bstr573]|uniref:feruloyl-CoA synthase n=1 Tax=Aliihoeflea sp. 40Bstr573 TaxID=2696467 RepID=UPI0020951013|nr:feruloyl-CoA synthase [Aliihoeflea sp. 40Bstr573]MCO6386575.1 AMP-binding protein [Aliihoeflea sp. 40Bstr573]